MPFYKRTGDILESAASSVHAPGYTLEESTHADHSYPVEGWWWFADLDAAMSGLIGTGEPAGPLDELARFRYLREVGGTVWNGWPVATDRDSQGKAAGVYLMASQGLWPDGAHWKFGDHVARPLTAEQVMSMALTIAAHVQTCFEREAALSARIRAGDTLSLPGDWDAIG
jgi:hypothetical protein